MTVIMCIFKQIEFLQMERNICYSETLSRREISIPPKIRISDFVRTIKSITGRLLKKRFEYMRKAYWGTDGIWSDGYFVSTIGVNDEIIKKYIERQYKEDVGQAQLALDLFKVNLSSKEHLALSRYHGACPVDGVFQHLPI